MLLKLLNPIARAQELDATQNSSKPPEDFEKGGDGSFVRNRNDWFYRQRAYPHKRIPSGVRLKALKQLDAKLAAESVARTRAMNGRVAAPSLNTSSTTSWQQIGPQ